MLQGVPANDGLSGTHYRKDVDVVGEAPFGNLFTQQGDVADCSTSVSYFVSVLCSPSAQHFTF